MEYFVVRPILSNGSPDLSVQRLSWFEYVVLRFRVYVLRQRSGVFGMFSRPKTTPPKP